MLNDLNINNSKKDTALRSQCSNVLEAADLIPAPVIVKLL